MLPRIPKPKRHHPIFNLNFNNQAPPLIPTPKKTSGVSWPMMSFGLSTLLAVSETLPFYTNLESNGIIDAIKIAMEHLKNI